MLGLGSAGRSQDAATVVLRVETGEANREINEVEREWLQAMRSMSSETLRLNLAEERLVRTLHTYKAGSAQATRALIAVRDAEEKARRSALGLDEAAKRSSSSFFASAKRMLLYTGGVYALGRAFTSTLQVAGEFQRSLNVFQVVTEASAAEMARAREEAIRLGKDITLPATSAKDAAEAMTTFAKAGVNVRDSIAASEGALRLAAAAGVDVTTATTIAARSMQAFGLAGEEASRVADVFAAAANASTGEIPDFALALQQAATVAKNWNLSIEETVATLGLLANKAIIGSDAGTSLRVMLTRLVPVSEKAKDEMERLGLSAFTATGQMKPYRQILQEYHDVLVKLSPEQRKLAVQTIFGQDAQRAANAVIIDGIQSYDKMLASVEKVGAAQQLAAARNKGYLGALDAFKSAVETLQISIGTALLPTITEALKDLTAWVNRLEESGTAAEEFSKAVNDIVGVVRGFAGALRTARAAAQPVINALGGVENAAKLAFGVWMILRLRAIAAGLGLVSTRALTAAASMNTLAAAEARAATAGAGLGRVGALGRLAGLGGPVGWAITAGAVALTITHSRGVGQKAKWDALSAAEQQDIYAQMSPRERYFFDQSGWVLKTVSASNFRAGAPESVRNNRGNRSNNRGNRPAAGDGGNRPAAGDGLTRLQRLELAADQAELTESLADDLRAARAIEGYYRKVASNEKLKGDALYKARQDLLAAQKRTQQIEDQIADDRQRAAEEAAEKRRKAAEKRRKAEEAAAAAEEKRMRQENAARVARRQRLLRAGAAGDKQAMRAANAAARNKDKEDKDKDGVTAADIARAVSEALAAMVRIQQTYGSNVMARPAVTVNQTFPQPTPDRHVEARHARFAFRAAMEG